MSFYQIVEKFSIAIRLGVRRKILFFCGFCLLLLIPFYFVGGFWSSWWATSNWNVGKIADRIYWQKKELKKQDWQISETQKLEMQTGEVVLYASISNKNNAEIGFNPAVLNISVLSETGALLKSYQEEAYILPGQVFFVVASGLKSEAIRLVIESDPLTKEIFFPQSRQIKYSNLQVQATGASLKENPANSQFVTLSFRLQNNEVTRNFNQVDVLCIVRDSRQSIVGIAKRRISKLRAMGESDLVSFDYPKPKERRADFLDIQWQINYLDPKLESF